MSLYGYNEQKKCKQTQSSRDWGMQIGNHNGDIQSGITFDGRALRNNLLKRNKRIYIWNELYFSALLYVY